MQTYAISSQKGGVGKTTTTVNLGAALAVAGKRVLLIDLDPQASLTAAVGVQPSDVTTGDILMRPEAILHAAVKCAGAMRVITTTPTLAATFLDLDEVESPQYRLKTALGMVSDSYDYTLIDCPPCLGHATSNALTAANVALVPLQCEFLSLRGLADVREIAAAIQATTNPQLRLRVVATMFDRRTTHARDVLDEACAALPGLVYGTVIPRTVRLAEAPATGQTILEYAPDSNGAFGYLALANEVMQEITEEDAGYGTPQRHSGSYATAAFAAAA